MSTYAKIPEFFFHYLWKNKLLKPGLKTQSGQRLAIIHPGHQNMDSGPDFSFARLKIGNTIWAGSVEIHKCASEWYRHGHHHDPAYDNVILHVVAEDDRPVRASEGRKLETLCLQGTFNSELLQRYHDIMHNLLWIPCERMIGDVHPLRIRSVIHARAIERIISRADKIKEELISLQGDWEECTFRLIARQFGARVNTSAFDTLAGSLPVRVLMAHHTDLFQLESLLFGQSGLLITGRGEYPRRLKKEHAYLSAKYSLSPMPAYLWKFLRMRPAAFPTLRIAQLAALYHKRQSVLTEILEADSIKVLLSLFDLEASDYWDRHYIFDKISKKQAKRFGDQSIQLMLVNAIVPLLHLYGHEMNKPAISERAISFLEALTPEDNAIIRRFASLGIGAEDSLESQGLLQLKKSCCDNKKCLECGIGHHLLNKL